MLGTQSLLDARNPGPPCVRIRVQGPSSHGSYSKRAAIEIDTLRPAQENRRRDFRIRSRSLSGGAGLHASRSKLWKTRDPSVWLVNRVPENASVNAPSGSSIELEIDRAIADAAKPRTSCGWQPAHGSAHSAAGSNVAHAVHRSAARPESIRVIRKQQALSVASVLTFLLYFYN